MKRFNILLIFFFLFLPIFVVRAQSVKLLWQGETYTPPFYEGASLWTNQSRVTLVAVTHGLGNPNTLNYKWTKNGTVLGNINGVGKDSLSFTDSIISRAQNIKVEVLSGQNQTLAESSVYITPQTTLLNIYENNPLYGFMFNKEVGKKHNLIGKEITFVAFPLFFSASSRIDNNLKYSWQANTSNVDVGNSITYRVPENTSGSSQISVGVSNGTKITQSANKSFLVQFEK